MKNLRQLIDDESYIDNLSRFAKQSIDSTKQVHQLAISLMLACLRRQLQTNIGKELVKQILDKHIQRTKVTLAFDLPLSVDFAASILEGNRLLGTILPGKKSVIMKIIGQYVKLSFKTMEPIVGQGSYILFTRLAADLLAHNDMVSLMLPFNELEKLTPELSHKDYIDIGSYPILPVSIPVSSITTS